MKTRSRSASTANSPHAFAAPERNGREWPGLAPRSEPWSRTGPPDHPARQVAAVGEHEDPLIEAAPLEINLGQEATRALFDLERRVELAVDVFLLGKPVRAPPPPRINGPEVDLERVHNC